MPLYRFIVVVCCWTLGWSPWGRSLIGSFSSPSSRAFRVGVASNVSRGTRSPGSLTRPPPGSCSTQLNSIFFFFFCLRSNSGFSQSASLPPYFSQGLSSGIQGTAPGNMPSGLGTNPSQSPLAKVSFPKSLQLLHPALRSVSAVSQGPLG